MNIFRQSTVYTDPSQTANPLYQTQENEIKDKTWEVQADYTNKISDMPASKPAIRVLFSGMPVRLIPIPERQPKISDDESLYNRFLYNQDVHASLHDIRRKME